MPDLAVQHLMRNGYGFGAEGDWKTSALVRAMKVMSAGLKGGASFIENYTYHFSVNGDKVLGAHMLEICASITSTKPKLESLPLSIGGRADPVRLTLDAHTRPAVGASIMDMGQRFRIVANMVDVIPTDASLPKLPVPGALWIPCPELKVAAWLYAGAPHWLQLCCYSRTLERFRRDSEYRIHIDRQKHYVEEFKERLR